MKKSIKKLQLARESIRTISLREHQLPLVVGGNSGQITCGNSCEPSGVIACTVITCGPAV